jgi:hypothetical protein
LNPALFTDTFGVSPTRLTGHLPARADRNRECPLTSHCGHRGFVVKRSNLTAIVGWDRIVGTTFLSQFVIANADKSRIFKQKERVSGVSITYQAIGSARPMIGCLRAYPLRTLAH